MVGVGTRRQGGRARVLPNWIVRIGRVVGFRTAVFVMVRMPVVLVRRARAGRVVGGMGRVGGVGRVRGIGIESGAGLAQ